MKTIYLILIISVVALSCNSTRQPVSNSEEINLAQNDTVKISSDNVEYEITIIEPGFNNWLLTRAKPEGYYSIDFMENRNWIYVTEWNQRVLQPQRYNNNLYEMQINYEKGVDYGYEVNYKLYNYFIYFQLKYKQQLSYFIPRI